MYMYLAHVHILIMRVLYTCIMHDDACTYDACFYDKSCVCQWCMYLWCIYQALVGADNMTTIATPHLLLYPRVVLDTARDICPCPVLLDPSELVLSLLVVKCYWSVMAEVWRIKCATSEFYGCLWCREAPYCEAAAPTTARFRKFISTNFLGSISKTHFPG